eukprot:GILJ01001305.1.p1 GENE.GILJ01001305.1~~GILJ01001305.1.p1  ORF type:complete len:217 (+),score=18.32 GILJ01001305.1:44-652(+)
MSTAYMPPMDSGHMDLGAPQAETNTLDESVSTTIMRDLRTIGYKLKYVLLPRMRADKGKELRNWDLWGPLLLCLMLSLTLSVGAPESQKSLLFSASFVIVWCGAAVVTLNALLLGGNISFFQSVCVLGYCIFPLNIAALFIATLTNVLPLAVKFVFVVAGFVWATTSSVGFMAALVPDNRKALAVYPVLLFYVCIGWMILIQ